MIFPMRSGVIAALLALTTPAFAEPVEWSGFFGVDKLPSDIALGRGTAPEQRPQTAPMFGGRVTYLSDLPVAGYKHVPFLQLAWEAGIDRSVTGTRMRASERLCAKGIGMHSTSRLTYRLDRPWRRLQAEICLDDAAGPAGSVVFRVFVDKEERLASPVVRSGDPPLPIDVDVSGAPELLDMMEVGCLLGPIDVWVETIDRRALDEASG